MLIIYKEIKGYHAKITEIHYPPTTGKYTHTVQLLRSGARPNALSKYLSEHYDVLRADLNRPMATDIVHSYLNNDNTVQLNL